MICTANKCTQGRIACTKTQCNWHDEYDMVPSKLGSACLVGLAITLFAVFTAALCVIWSHS